MTSVEPFLLFAQLYLENRLSTCNYVRDNNPADRFQGLCPLHPSPPRGPIAAADRGCTLAVLRRPGEVGAVLLRPHPGVVKSARLNKYQ